MPHHLYYTLRAPLWLALLTAALATPVLAGSGRIPSDSDKLPKGVQSAPAVVSQCMACHGPGGLSEYDDWPNLAGQKQAYVLQQLKDFKSGARQHPMMAPAIAVLTESDFKTLADYFSRQASAQPHVPAGQQAAAQPPSAATCVACHDNAALPAEPFLHAQKPNYLAEQLRAYKSGARKNATMEAMAKLLSDQDINAVAHYFSTLAPVAPAAPAATK